MLHIYFALQLYIFPHWPASQVKRDGRLCILARLPELTIFSILQCCILVILYIGAYSLYLLFVWSMLHEVKFTFHIKSKQHLTSEKALTCSLKEKPAFERWTKGHFWSKTGFCWVIHAVLLFVSQTDLRFHFIFFKLRERFEKCAKRIEKNCNNMLLWLKHQPLVL